MSLSDIMTNTPPANETKKLAPIIGIHQPQGGIKMLYVLAVIWMGLLALVIAQHGLFHSEIKTFNSIKTADRPKMSIDFFPFNSFQRSLKRSIDEATSKRGHEILKETAPMSEERLEQVLKLVEKFEPMFPNIYREKESCMLKMIKTILLYTDGNSTLYK